jgi:hypothetical protein
MANEMKWSPAEKAISRKAFHLALHREFEAVIQEVRNRAAGIKEPSDLWDLEEYLTRSRKMINNTYDFRYSMLPMVFTNLIFEGRLSLEDLHGLREDKLADIRRGLSLANDWAARHNESESEVPSA